MSGNLIRVAVNPPGGMEPSHLAPPDMQRRYLTSDDGTVFGRVNGTHCIVLASVRE